MKKCVLVLCEMQFVVDGVEIEQETLEHLGIG